MRMHGKTIIRVLIAAAIIFFILSGLWQIIRDFREPSEGVPSFLRLHLLANSDLPADQDIKLKIRDLLVAELSSEYANATSLAEAVQHLNTNLPVLENKINQYLKSAGFAYSVRGQITKEVFPPATYQELHLPAGTYLSLQMVLGKGEGRNWWCVLYPPLCLQEGLPSQAVPVLAEDQNSEINSKNNYWDKLKMHCKTEIKKIIKSQ